MKKLKCTDWMNSEEICEFINDNNIPASEIQSIVAVTDSENLILFYWVKI